MADDDLEAVASGEALLRRVRPRRLLRPEEYVTGHTYDVVERFQQLGGNLVFLSANNFFTRSRSGGT